MARRLSSVLSPSKGETDADARHSLVKKLSNSLLNQPSVPPQVPKHKYSASGGRNQAPASLAPPPMFADSSLARPRSSHESNSRPLSIASSVQSGADLGQSPPQLHSRPITPASPKPNKRKGNVLVKGGRSSNDTDAHSRAWVAGLKDIVAYELEPLLQGKPVPDLWHEHGDTLIHLYPRSSGRGPSFKVHSCVFADSQSLNDLRFEGLRAVHEAIVSDGPVQIHVPTLSGPILDANYSSIGANTLGQVHIWLPLELERPSSGEEVQGKDSDLIVLYRNFFAFLTGGALVSTPRVNGLYAIFTGISGLLQKYSFRDDGSTWGNVATASFANYCEELSLGDVRFNRQRTIEAIVLGERMRFWPLYNEGFVHATGTLDEVKAIASPEFTKISHITLNRLERASIDLEARLLAVQHKLSKFDFPSMFSGAANSQTSVEAKSVSFKAWKEAFFDFQKFVLSYYKRKYGAWPPKASKKNSFEEPGLNRLVLRGLYQDFTELYDMLVDRTCLTPRTEGVYLTPLTTAERGIESTQHALRVIESEYDRSTPPVAPPIPFDVPIVPAFATSFDRTHVIEFATRPQASATVKLKRSAVSSIFLGSYNRDQIRASSFIQEFMAYERKLGEGRTLDEIIDNRCGQWLFLYAVIQSLPMTVVDARDVKFTDGVEHFLCIGPRGGRPWMKEDTSQSRAWYNVASGGGYVSLPADMIDHSVEGIYRRSHCWQVATQWVAADPTINSPQSETTRSQSLPGHSPPRGLLAPNPIGGGDQAGATQVGRPRRVSSSTNFSPSDSPLIRPQSAHSDGRLSQRHSQFYVNLGLEAAPAPPPKAARPVSVLNPEITFDTILAESGNPAHGKTKKK